jgi:hypothetical protein
VVQQKLFPLFRDWPQHRLVLPQLVLPQLTPLQLCILSSSKECPMHRFLLTAAFFLPVTAFAASAPESEPPTPTETTMKCTDGQVWSETAVPAAIETETEIETQTEVVTETATQTEAEAVSETATQTEVDPAKTGACVDPQSGALDDDTLYKAARELAYAEQYPETLKVLAQMSDPQDDRVLTYLGFVQSWATPITVKPSPRTPTIFWRARTWAKALSRAARPNWPAPN